MTTAKKETVTIRPPNIVTAGFTVIGTAPYVQNKFSAKAKEQMRQAQMAGGQRRKGEKREAKDFQKCYQDAMHLSTEGWNGIPAPAFRCAMIDACKVAGFHATKAKLTVFTETDGFDADDGTPLVKITKGKPQYHEALVRPPMGGADLRARPMWREGWEAVVRISYDADMFSLTDVTNLLATAGRQVGIGEGRPSSKKSSGMGWGTFRLKEGKE